MIHILDSIVDIIKIVGLIAGALLILYPFLIPALKNNKIFSNFGGKSTSDKSRKKTKLYRHLELLLAVTLNSKRPYAIWLFITVILSIFVSTMLFLAGTDMKMFERILMAAFLSVLPYLYLMLRLRTARVDGSYEADKLVTELANQYKINHYNMREAIDQTVMRLKHAPYSKKALFRLAIANKTVRNDEQLEGIMQEFNFALDTDWAILLSNNIYIALKDDDMNVSEALEDIIEDLKELKTVVEQEKQYNNEAFVMVKYVVPGTYLLSILTLFKVFNFTGQKFIDFQFKHPLGLQMFIMMFSLFIFSYIVYLFVKKPKNDF
jgi:hypothetical protein